MVQEIVCRRCGKTVLAAHPARRYCDECAEKVSHERDVRRKMIKQHEGEVVECTCTDCGRVFYAHIRYSRCFYCARDRDQFQSTVGYCSPGGERLVVCRECGSLFVSEGGRRKCTGCVEADALRKEQKKHDGKEKAPERRRVTSKKEKKVTLTPMEREMARVKGPNAAIRRTMVAAKYAGYGASYGRYVADHGGEL